VLLSAASLILLLAAGTALLAGWLWPTPILLGRYAFAGPSCRQPVKVKNARMVSPAGSAERWVITAAQLNIDFRTYGKGFVLTNKRVWRWGPFVILER